MKTFFIRHSSRLDIDEKTLSQLWKKNYIGIHYPKDKNIKFNKYDSKSTDPNDYLGKSKSALKILNNLASEGGYVFSVYKGYPGAKIGYIPPKSKIKLLRGKWGNLNNYEGREAILKVVKLSKTKILNRTETISFNSIQPQQGTICVWSKVGVRIERLVEDKILKKTFSYLTTDQQEVMCMEFMRLKESLKVGLPRIATTLTPVGRTMKDVDIFAISSEQKFIICKVTNYKFLNATNKLNLLIPLTKTKNTITILFCDIENEKFINGVLIFPIKKVFKLFCKETTIGKAWLKMLT